MFMVIVAMYVPMQVEAPPNTQNFVEGMGSSKQKVK
jgi:hypothetical protein